MTNEEARALEPGLYMLTWANGSGTSLAAVGQVSDGPRWYMAISRPGYRLWYQPPMASGSWVEVASAVRLDKDYTRARADVRLALYDHLSDPELDRVFASGIVDALIKAIGVTLALQPAAPLAESFPDLADVITAERAQDGGPIGWGKAQARDLKRHRAQTATPAGPTHAEDARVTRGAAEALDRAGAERAQTPASSVAHQRAALAYAAAKLEETGEAGTTAAARLLLGQISEDLA